MFPTLTRDNYVYRRLSNAIQFPDVSLLGARATLPEVSYFKNLTLSKLCHVVFGTALYSKKTVLNRMFEVVASIAPFKIFNTVVRLNPILVVQLLSPKRVGNISERHESMRKDGLLYIVSTKVVLNIAFVMFSLFKPSPYSAFSPSNLRITPHSPVFGNRVSSFVPRYVFHLIPSLIPTRFASRSAPESAKLLIHRLYPIPLTFA